MKIYSISLIICALLFNSCGGKTVGQENKLVSHDTIILDSIPQLCIKEDVLSLAKQDLKIFELWLLNNKSNAFVSLSDLAGEIRIDSISQVWEQLYKTKKKNIIVLDADFRKIFLADKEISETDSVFNYDYSKNILKSFRVKDLKLVVYVDEYDLSDFHWLDYSYEFYIGFEIPIEYLQGVSHSFVCIKKENPFEQGQMTKVVWKEIEQKEFPFSSINSKYEGSAIIVNQYKFETRGLCYYLQDFGDATQLHMYRDAKQLLVFDNNTQEKVYETIYYSSEYTVFTDLNEQWAGKLFKDKPPVIFDFLSRGYGCPHITILDFKEKEIEVYCDNRCPY